MKKTFKIGEYAKGGIIRVVITHLNIDIQIVDYYSKKLLYNQLFNNNGVLTGVENFIFNNTTSYYTDKIMDWIRKNI